MNGEILVNYLTIQEMKDELRRVIKREMNKHYKDVPTTDESFVVRSMSFWPNQNPLINMQSSLMTLEDMYPNKGCDNPLVLHTTFEYDLGGKKSRLSERGPLTCITKYYSFLETEPLLLQLTLKAAHDFFVNDSQYIRSPTFQYWFFEDTMAGVHLPMNHIQEYIIQFGHDPDELNTEAINLTNHPDLLLFPRFKNLFLNYVHVIDHVHYMLPAKNTVEYEKVDRTVYYVWR